MTDLKQGMLVRFAREANGGPVHRIGSVMRDGTIELIELNDLGGYFAPHLFVVADDIGDIPPRVASRGQRQIGYDEGNDDGKTLAVNFCVNEPSSMLGNPDWTTCDGTETWEGDVAGTLYNILVAAGVIDPDTNAVATHKGAENRERQAAEAMRAATVAALRERAAAFGFHTHQWEALLLAAEEIEALPLPTVPAAPPDARDKRIAELEEALSLCAEALGPIKLGTVQPSYALKRAYAALAGSACGEKSGG